MTLAGESAGSFSAFYHLTSAPATSPLFHRIIGQSGVGRNICFQVFLSLFDFQVGGLSPSYHHWSPEEGVSSPN